MRAAVVQIDAGADKAANMAAAARLIAAAAAEGADLISLPEMWTCLGGDMARKREAAEIISDGPPPEGSAQALLAQLAHRHGVTLHGGSIAEQEGERLFNTSLVYGPDGACLARYRKIHLFDVTTPGGTGYRESRYFGAGEAVVVCDTPAGRLGLAICYDLRFPELFAALRRGGAEMIMLPAAFTAETGRDHWEALLRARAIETQCPVIAAATCGVHHDGAGQPRETWGHSMIIDAWGQVRARLAAVAGHACADIDHAHTERVRNAIPLAAHHRLPGGV